MTTSTPTPTAELDVPYSPPDAAAAPWVRTEQVLAGAQIYWLSTVRSDGRPHVTPIIALWDHGAVHFCTGPEEQKAKNLATHPGVVVTTGTNVWSGLDVVVEGAAARVSDNDRLGELATAWEAKYGADWHFDVADGAFRHHGDNAHVFAVEPRKIFAYDRDDPGSATRYRF